MQNSNDQHENRHSHKTSLKMNMEYTKARAELPVISLKLTIYLEINRIQWTKMDIKVRTNTLLHLIHLKVKETIFLLQSMYIHNHRYYDTNW